MDDPQPIALSALQHWAYCPRQCALIYLEQAFDDNIHTLRSNAVHARVDQPGVEFGSPAVPYPVEYKHGNRHKAAAIAACDDLQLAAQALCLESGLAAVRAHLFEPDA